MADNIIRTRYRLQPQDLAGRRMDVTITNVTIEGLESLTPVLHFDGIEKPMALHPGDANDMARITHSAVFHEWIGQTVSIASIDTGNGPRLAIFSPEQQTLDRHSRVRHRSIEAASVANGSVCAAAASDRALCFSVDERARQLGLAAVSAAGELTSPSKPL